MALPGKYIEELTELTGLDGSEEVLASKTGATEDYKFTLTRFKNWFLSLTGLSFKENVTFEKQIISTVANGTAPFVASSTTKSLIDVDKVDGYDLDQALLTTSSPTFATVNFSNLTTGYIPYDTSTGLANTGIYWDNVNSRLGIGTTTPGSQLAIFNPASDATFEVTGSAETSTSRFKIGRNARNWELVANNAAAGYFFSLSYIGVNAPVSNILNVLAGGNVGIGTINPAEKHDVNGISRSTNFKKNAFYITKNLAASANITSATAVNVQMNASTDYEYVISPGITATLNFNDASFQYNSITMVYVTGGNGLILTSPGVTFYQNGVALVGGAVVGYDGTKANRIRVTVKSATVFTVDLNISASGSNISTIGTNGDYATISAAVTAGKKNLVLISNITEIADVSISTYFNLDLGGYTLAMGSYNFTFSNTLNYRIENGTITFAYAAEKILLTGTASNCFVSKVTITNSSTINNARISDLANFSDSTFNVSNYTYSGFGKSGENFTGDMNNCEIIGGGTSCQFAILAASSTIAKLLTKIKLSGQFSSNCSYISNVSGIEYTGTTNSLIVITTGNNILDLSGANRLTIDVRLSILNFRCASVLPSSNASLTNGNVLTAQNFNSANSSYRFTNVNFAESVTVESDAVTFNNCHVGSVAAGTKTITINAAADKTIIIGNRTEAAIVDNGTGTIGAALNTIF